MRILQMIGTVDPKAGGPSEAVRALVRYRPAGYEVEVLCLDDPAAEFLKDIPCPVHALGAPVNGLGYNPNLLSWLKANRERFDGVMVHGLWRYFGFATWRALRG